MHPECALHAAAQKQYRESIRSSSPLYATQLWLRCHSSFCDRRGVNVQPLLERVSYLETELESYVVLRVPAVAPFSLGRPSLCALALCSPRSERACVQLENRDLKLQLNEALRYATSPNRV